jgi:hypothetical protein
MCGFVWVPVPANVLIYTEMREDFVILNRSSQLSPRESPTSRIDGGSREAIKEAGVRTISIE